MKKFSFIFICIGLLFLSVGEDVRAETDRTNAVEEESKAIWEEILNHIKIYFIVPLDEDDLTALQVCGEIHIERQVAEFAYPNLNRILSICFMEDEYAEYFPPETVQAVDGNRKEDSATIFSRSSVSHFFIAHDIGYLRIRTFEYEGVAKEIEKILISFSQRGIKKVAIDITGNHGGIVDEAWQSSDFFVSDSKKATFKGYRGEIASAPLVALRTVKDKGMYSAIKTAVLVNSGTASAAEIFARVLQLQGVKIIGSDTYGKGRAQKFYELSNGGGLQLTSLVVYDFLGGTFDKGYGGKGIIPDIKTNSPLAEAVKYLSK